MSVKFGSKTVGSGSPCFITFEAGPTHSGLESAKDLSLLASQAGADAIKFQILDPDRLVADKNQLMTYEVLTASDPDRTEIVREPLYDILSRRYMNNDEWSKLKKYCESLGLSFFATIGFDEELDLVERLGCESVKIASSDINHFPFLRKVARTGTCIQLDTGMSTIGEIESAVDVIRAEGNERIIIHNCPSGYPARLESINLKLIKTLKQLLPYPVAFSDHTPGWDMDIAALSFGADLIEKTITHSRLTKSIEHMFSLEPADMERFIQTIRDVETAFGNSRRILHPNEVIQRNSLRRSVFLKESVLAGARLCDVSVEFRRPGTGISPDHYERISKCTFRRDCPSGHQISLEDLI